MIKARVLLLQGCMYVCMDEWINKVYSDFLYNQTQTLYNLVE